ncbi:MAG: hypothetical protein LBR84_09780 [Tannerella sp.]|jgi:hypothetical protein|nr:hypothetical protein [Tannerella sp.]
MDYGRIAELADRVVRGDARIYRLPRKDEAGRIAAGRIAVEASCVAGEEFGTHTGKCGSEYEVYERVEQALKQWAVHTGVWYSLQRLEDEIVSPAEKVIDLGVESVVYFVGGSVYKVMRSNHHNPLLYIDNRLALHNSLFPDVRYELLGITEDEHREQQFVIRQPKVQGETIREYALRNSSKYGGGIEADITKEIYVAVNRKMFAWGFEQGLYPYQYINDYYRIDDANPGNIMFLDGHDPFSPATEFFFIDTAPKLNVDAGMNYLDFEITDNK